MFRKNALAMLVAEFLGTAVLTLGVLALSHSQLSVPFFIATAAGVVLAIMVVAFGNVSGSVFNPALTVGLAVVRKLRPVQALAYVVVQVLGALGAWYLFAYLAKIDTGAIANKAEFNNQLMVAEFVGTLIFALAVASVVYQKLSVGAKAFGIGGGLVAGSIIGSIGSGGILNPAVAIALHQFNISTVVGPIVGALLGFVLYSLLFTDRLEGGDMVVEHVETVTASPAQVVTSSGVRAAAKRKTVRKTPVKKTAKK